MSFSKSASGTKDSILEQVKHWPQQVADASIGLTEKAKQGHAAQVAAGVSAIESIAEVFPDIMSATCFGHASEDGSGNFGGSYTILKRESGGDATGA